MASQFQEDLEVVRIGPLRRKLRPLRQHLPADIVGIVMQYCFPVDVSEPIRDAKGRLCYKLPEVGWQGCTAKFAREIMLIRGANRYFGEIDRDLINADAIVYVGNGTFILLKIYKTGCVTRLYINEIIRINSDYFARVYIAMSDDHYWSYIRRHPCGTVQLHDHNHDLTMFWDPWSNHPTQMIREYCYGEDNGDYTDVDLIPSDIHMI